MNERIQELMRQATNPDYDGDDGPANELNIEKFAQLIAGECIASIPSDGHRGDFLRGVEFCQLKIKAQFGIAE